MKTKLKGLLVGLFVGVVATATVSYYIQKDYRSKHADCPLNEMELFLKSMASLSDQDQKKIESIFNTATSESSYPTYTFRNGSFRTLQIMYNPNLGKEEKDEAAASIIMDLVSTLENDDDLEFILGERFEQVRSEVDRFLSSHPQIDDIYKKLQ